MVRATAVDRRADPALLRVDCAEALDDLEMASARLGDLMFHARVVLGDHGRGAAGPSSIAT